MKKKLYRKGALLFAGVLLTNVCMATSLSKYEVIKHCHDESETLMRLSTWNKTAPCVESVESSAKHIALAANSVRDDQIPYALMHLSFARQVLAELSLKTECAYFSIKTKPDLVILTQLSIDVERLDRYQPNRSSIQQR